MPEQSANRKAMVAGVRCARYAREMRWPIRLSALLASVVMLSGSGCTSFPPAVTGITIYPSDTDGTPRGETVWRTREQPPLRVIGVRPGADPHDPGWFLNDPATGDVAITLARGVQSFVLFASTAEAQNRFVIAIYLDHEATPSLSAVVTRKLTDPVAPSRAATLIGLEGQLVTNRSAASVIRAGYRVSLLRAAFPLETLGVDALNLWRLRWDGVVDWAAVITLQVEPASS